MISFEFRLDHISISNSFISICPPISAMYFIMPYLFNFGLISLTVCILVQMLKCITVMSKRSYELGLKQCHPTTVIFGSHALVKIQVLRQNTQLLYLLGKDQLLFLILLLGQLWLRRVICHVLRRETSQILSIIGYRLLAILTWHFARSNAVPGNHHQVLRLGYSSESLCLRR